MELLLFWYVGLGLAIVTRIKLGNLTGDDFWKPDYYIEYRDNFTIIIMNILETICIIVVGGIPIATIISFLAFAIQLSFSMVLLIAVICSIFIIWVGIYLLGLYHFGHYISKIIFAIFFIISIIAWTNYIYNYNRNIETVRTVAVASTKTFQITYFNPTPVQEILNTTYGYGELENRSIRTIDKLQYWFINSDDEVTPGSVPANRSKIDYISDEENPYLEVISYNITTTVINHNNNTQESSETPSEYDEYIFHVPKNWNI